MRKIKLSPDVARAQNYRRHVASQVVAKLENQISIISPEEIEKKELFLKNFSETGMVVGVLDSMGMSHTVLNRWEQTDSEFRQKFHNEKEKNVERLERSAYVRAVNGDTLLTIFLLKSLKPEIYSDRPTARGIAASMRMGGFASVAEAAFGDAPDDLEQKRIGTAIRKNMRTKHRELTPKT